MGHFATSIQHITGQELEVTAATGLESSNLVQEELEALRIKVDELSEEVSNF
jgi:diaphanous 1